MKKLVVVDYLKGFSIFTIVVMHLLQDYLELPDIFKKVLSFGGAGVHIFIICSGFGLYYSQLNKKLSYKEFLKKRFTKIYIPYILIVLVSALIPVMYSYGDKIYAVLSHVLLYKMFIERYECSFGVQFWFISTIIQFYLIFNILVIVKNKINNDKKYLLLCLCISIFWWVIIGILNKNSIRVWNSFFLQYLWEFSLGMVLANRYYRNNVLHIPKKTNLISAAICGLFIAGLTAIIGGALTTFNDIPSVIGYGGVALYIYSVNNKGINTFFLKMSKISYEWYLVHMLVFKVVYFCLNDKINNYFMIIIAFLTSIFVAKLYHSIFNLLQKSKLNK